MGWGGGGGGAESLIQAGCSPQCRRINMIDGRYECFWAFRDVEFQFFFGSRNLKSLASIVWGFSLFLVFLFGGGWDVSENGKCMLYFRFDLDSFLTWLFWISFF